MAKENADTESLLWSSDDFAEAEFLSSKGSL